MNGRARVVLPGYDSYRSVLSHETAVYQSTDKSTALSRERAEGLSSVSASQKASTTSVIETIVTNMATPEDKVPLAKELLQRIEPSPADLARNDAEDLEDSGDYDE